MSYCFWCSYLCNFLFCWTCFLCLSAGVSANERRLFALREALLVHRKRAPVVTYMLCVSAFVGLERFVINTLGYIGRREAFDMLLQKTWVPLEIPHKMSCPYIERCTLNSRIKRALIFQGLGVFLKRPTCISKWDWIKNKNTFVVMTINLQRTVYNICLIFIDDLMSRNSKFIWSVSQVMDLL